MNSQGVWVPGDASQLNCTNPLFAPPLADGTTSQASDAPRSHAIVAGAWPALALLICINIFNFVDRQVLAAVEPEIQHEFFPDTGPVDENANFKMGVLAFAFLATYTLTAPIFGWLASRMSS